MTQFTYEMVTRPDGEKAWRGVLSIDGHVVYTHEALRLREVIDALKAQEAKDRTTVQPPGADLAKAEET